MKKETILIIVLAFLVLVTLIQSFQIAKISGITGKATSTAGSASGKIDMTGWTENEKMNYEMHGVIPSRVGGGSSGTGSGGMVGGC